MSLLDQASLIVTPNGYKADKLYSVKPTDASGDMTVVRATTATRVNSAGVIQSVAINVPRLDYPPLGGCPRILIEPERINKVFYSEEFDNIYWSKFAATVSANVSASPEGNTTADLVYPSSTGALKGQVFRALTGITLGDVVTVSVFVKASSKNFAYIAPLYNFSPAAYFNLSTGAITSPIPNVTTSMTAFANGWWRISVTSTATATSFISIGSTDDASGSNINTASGTDGILLWGAQVEVGTTASSYIPTVASTITRNADVISKTGVSSLIGQTEGTIYAEIKVTKLLGAASRYVFHLSDGTANNRIYIAFSGADSNVLRARIFSGGTLQCSINSSALTSTGTYKLAMAYKNNDIVFYINGIQIGTDTSATIPTCSKVDLGHNQGGASQFNDGINNANIWKTRLTNAQLATLTTL
jgi:hypothetical protein